MKNEIKPDMALEKIRFLEQNLHSEVIGDFSPYFSGVPVDFKDFTAVPGFLKSINQNDTQQFGVVFSIPEKERLEYYNCFNEFRYSWGHTVHAERLTVIKTPLSQITDEDAIEVAKVYRSNVRGYSVIGASGVSKEEFLRAGKEFCKRLDGNFWNNFANMFNMLAAFDFLRSRGYALPFMGRSVPEMVELGWIKLKGDSNHG